MRTREINLHRIICRAKATGDFKVIVYKPSGLHLYIESDYPRLIGIVGSHPDRRGWWWKVHPRGPRIETSSKQTAIQELVDQWDHLAEINRRKKAKRLTNGLI